METRALTSIYRPKRYSDVVGQSIPVEFLSNLSHRGIRRHILLHGSIGSGKTTLARIYAMSLHCSAKLADGSPCVACDGCLSVNSESGKFVELDAPTYDDKEDFQKVLRFYQRHRPAPGSTRVIFIDEAHSIRKWHGAMDILLKELELDAGSTTYILATTQPEAISNPVKSRMVQLQVNPLSCEQGSAFLRSILKQEKFDDFEDEALTLIWGLGGGQPRNMLHALDLAKSRGRITRDVVCEMSGVDDTRFLLRYVAALGEFNFGALSKALLEWPATIQRKVVLIHGALLSVYYNEILNGALVLNPVVASLKAVERRPIVEAVRSRFPDERRRTSAWLEMLSLLPAVPGELTEEALWSSLALFHDRLCQPDLGEKQPFADELPVYRPAVVRPKVGSKVDLKDPRYLSGSELRKILQYASAFTQHHGRQFNVMITLRHDRFGMKEQQSAGKNAGAFSNQLGQRLTAWFGCNDRMLVQEFDPKTGLCARLIISLPDLQQRTVVQLGGWIRNWRLERRNGQVAGDGITFEVASDTTGMKAHWECVRWLCGGAKPDADIEALGLPHRIAGDVGNAVRFASSDSCGERLIAENRNIPFLSAFATKNWSHMYSGWEIKAFEIRSLAGTANQECPEARRNLIVSQLNELRDQFSLAQAF